MRHYLQSVSACLLHPTNLQKLLLMENLFEKMLSRDVVFEKTEKYIQWRFSLHA